MTLSRNTLNDIILQQTTAADAVSSGDIQVEGEQAKLEELVLTSTASSSGSTS